MICGRTRRVGGWLAGLLAATVLFSLPAPGLAAEPADQLSAAGTLARGAGYASAAGSEPVRQLQRRLHRLGDRPGPIDGLYGPLTEGAVERFQEAHGLATDGIVGPRTKRRLLAQRAERPVADNPRTPPAGKLERKSPVGDSPAESAIEPHSARSTPSEGLSRAGPPSSTGPPVELLALLAAGAAAALLIAMRAYGRRGREATVNFGMVCAALLAVFVFGAVIGAVFATQAAPDGGGETSADSGALLAARSAPSHRAAGATPQLGRVVQARRARPASTARRPAPRAHLVARSARHEPQALVDNRRVATTAPPQSQPRPAEPQRPPRPQRQATVERAAQVAKKAEALRSLDIGRMASGGRTALEGARK
jgi:putative peptidoglycan binding protein